MKKRLILSIITCAMYASSHAQPAVTGYPYQQVPFTGVKLSTGSFWGNRLKAAKDVTIPLAFSLLPQNEPVESLTPVNGTC